MIKIKKVEINNYKSCIKTKFDINTNLTTLIGANSVGKTNILNSLQLLKKNNRNRYFHRKELADSQSHTKLTLQLEIDGEMYNLQSDIYYETNENNTEDIYSSEIKIKNISTAGNKWLGIDDELYELVDYANKTNKNLSKLEIEHFLPRRSDNNINNIFAIKLIQYLTKISYYSATQFSDPTKCPISLELEDSKLIRPYRKNGVHDLFIYDLYKSFKTNKKAFLRYLNTINKNGIGLIDDITFLDYSVPSSSYKVRTGGQMQKIEKTKNIVVPSITVDNLSLSPNQLSEGTFKTLALIFYIMNDDSDLLLIEEPEVCVHHGLLSSVIELIKIQSKNKQIFVSTHSDYILDKLLPENIVLVKKTRETGTTAETLTKSLSKNDFKALKEYLEESGNLGEYWKEGGFENE
ncbi:AAA family ATPase [Hymenobacter psychrotolerans]|uniref:Predicted ATPase n=1 Tax=Hymenobacter psychrotolerans DSM 18569 TaxID=1121959 RepID=A0A1M6SN50_9BACT|nr:ATP-binding protein [Hymenobacter psychrotolerans]SHK46067.1 Predicted ATPase [Hymenobacter psychrotolerans DSM 18569]